MRRHCETCTCIGAEVATCLRCLARFTRGGHDGQRQSDAVYCSRRCAKAAAEQARRDRKKAAA